VGVELDDKAKSLSEYKHLERCIYLLGAEDNGLSKKALNYCHQLIKIDYQNMVSSLNVSTAGSIIMYDRFNKELRK